MSGLALRKSGVVKNASRIHVHQAGSSKTAVAGHIRQSGTLKTFFAELAVALSAAVVRGTANSSGTVTVGSASVTANVTGGTGTLTYSWTRTAPDAQVWTIANPSSPTTYFYTSCSAASSFTATFHCTVTDGLGQTVVSSDVEADCANNYFGGVGGGGGPYP